MPRLPVTFHYVADGKHVGEISVNTSSYKAEVEHEGRRLRDLHGQSIEARQHGEAFVVFSTEEDSDAD